MQDRHFQPWAGWTAAALTGLAILGAALGGLGLLEPPKVWAAGTRYHPDAYVPPPAAAPPILPVPTTTPSTFPTPAPGHTPTSVSARRPCRPGDLTLAGGEFEAAMGHGLRPSARRIAAHQPATWTDSPPSGFGRAAEP